MPMASTGTEALLSYARFVRMLGILKLTSFNDVQKRICVAQALFTIHSGMIMRKVGYEPSPSSL